MTQLPSNLRRTALTFASELRRVKDGYVERDVAVDVVALATLCREHVLLIGPPGTAKTGLLERFSKMLRAKYFAYLLTKFTEPAELFGAVDVPKFQAGNAYQINTKKMLPEADIAFLDEIFNGSSAILNTLLTLINERRFYNGAKRMRCDLITLLGAANDIPDDQVLQAFCDRFLFRCRLGYVSYEAIDEVLDIGWRAEQAEFPQSGAAAADADAAGFALDDVRALQQAVTTVDLSTVRDPLVKILQTFREERVTFSDRRAVKAQKAIAASAVLDGRATAELKDLAVLAHLWNRPYDEAPIRRVLEAYDVPVSYRETRRRDINEIRFQLSPLGGQIEVVQSREELREIIRLLGRLLNEVRAFHPESTDVLRDIQQLQRQAITELRSRFGENGGSYV